MLTMIINIAYIKEIHLTTHLTCDHRGQRRKYMLSKQKKASYAGPVENLFTTSGSRKNWILTSANRIIPQDILILLFFLKENFLCFYFLSPPFAHWHSACDEIYGLTLVCI